MTCQQRFFWAILLPPMASRKVKERWRSFLNIPPPLNIFATNSFNICRRRAHQEQVANLAKTFLKTNGDIRSVLKELLLSNYFWERKHYLQKFKTPYQYIVSSIRAAGYEVQNFRPVMNQLYSMEMPLYGCETPDGYKNTLAAWLSPDGMLSCIGFVTALANRQLPLTGSLQKNNLDKNLEQIDLPSLKKTLGDAFSNNTQEVVEKAPEKLRVELILSSPDFMRK